MTTLVVEDLYTDLEQNFTVETDINVLSIKVHLFSYNTPIGDFYFELLKDAALIKSEYFNNTILKNSFGGVEDYFRVMFPFFVNQNLKLTRGEYTLRIRSENYTNNGNSFLSWCSDWQGFGRVINAGDFTTMPLTFRIIETVQREL